MFEAVNPYASLANMPLLDVLRLIRTLNVGPISFFQLVRRYGTAGRALERLPELSLRGGRRNAVQPYTREQAEAEIEAVRKYGARIVKYGEDDYPALLHQIADAPPIVTIKGHGPLWTQKPCIAIVGARNASANGCNFALKLSRELGQDGLLVVSGLARGIDAMAHKAALGTGTVGVIAGGIDNVYPVENTILYQQLAESGCIISEQPFGQAPFSGAFPGRNRIISGMSLGVVVVEASPKSGTLITARFALDQGREVFAVPGSPLDPRARGCNQLIKQGAHIVEDADDVLNQLKLLRGKQFKEHQLPLLAFAEAAPMAEPCEQEIVEARSLVLEKLSYSAISVDEIVAQTNMPPSVLLTVLLELELAGRLHRSSGDKVSLLMETEARAG